MKQLFAGAALCVLVLAGTASAKEVKPINPNLAYALVEVGSVDDALMKGDSIAGSLTFAAYDAEKKDLKALPSATAGKIGPARYLRQSTIKPIGKSKKSRLYLVELSPETWVIEGANGTSFSLGSKTFVPVSGSVLDLGFFKPSIDWLEGEGPKSQVSALLGGLFVGRFKPKDERPIKMEWRARSASDLPLPASIASAKLVPVAFSDGATFGNHLGGLVNRLGGRAARNAVKQQAEPVSEKNN